MNHGSPSLDIVLESRKLSKRKNADLLRKSTSRGIHTISHDLKVFPHLAPLEITDELIKSLARTMHEKPLPKSNPRIPAAYTYFGQFLSHDITRIPQSHSDTKTRVPKPIPLLDLSSVYGKGASTQASLLQKDGLFFRLGENELGEADLPRNSAGKALIADPRNDISIMISQMHVCFLSLHNAFVRQLQKQDFSGDLFQEAKRLCLWHYQWLSIHDYVKRLVGEKILYQKISRPTAKKKQLKLKYLQTSGPSPLPLEFSGAVYRMGHSMVRPSYYLNEIPNTRNPRTGRAEHQAIQIFDMEKQNQDLRGNRVLPHFFSLQWNRFLVFPQSPLPQFSQRIDTGLAAPLAKVPNENGKALSMARQNLLRGKDFSLPSGQAIAKEMGIKPLAGVDGMKHTPLWYYVLQEAEIQHQGTQLGPVGGHLVAEVFLKALKDDPNSYLAQNPNWHPQQENMIIPMKNTCELRDLVAFAGMPIRLQDLEKHIYNNSLNNHSHLN